MLDYLKFDHLHGLLRLHKANGLRPRTPCDQNKIAKAIMTVVAAQSTPHAIYIEQLEK